MALKILVIDTGSEALDFCMRAMDYGHEVMWFCKKKDNREIQMAGKGIVPRLIDYELLKSRYIGWADLIWLTDNTHYTDLLEPFRKLGFPIFGPSPEAGGLERNRAIGQKAIKGGGGKTVPGITF